MSNIEEHGKFYIRSRTLLHSSGAEATFYEVGDIIDVGGARRYHPSSEFAGKTREEALAWIRERT